MSLRNSGPFGALTILACGFALSAALRAGDVVAALPGLLEEGFGHAQAAPPPAHGAEASNPGEVTTLVAQLREQRQKLDARAAQLDARAEMIAAIEARVKARLKELEAAQEKLRQTAVLVDDATGKDVRQLAEMYQQMKPKQAGLIFDQMAPSFAVGFLAAMRSDTAALILANMSPDRAYAVSLLMAGRNVARGAAAAKPAGEAAAKPTGEAAADPAPGVPPATGVQ